MAMQGASCLTLTRGRGEEVELGLEDDIASRAATKIASVQKKIHASRDGASLREYVLHGERRNWLEVPAALE